VSVNTWFQFHPPQKKSRVERLGERGGHGMSLKREMRCRGNIFWTMVIDSFAVCTVAPSCWNHTLAQSPPPAYLLSTTHSKDVTFPWVTLYCWGQPLHYYKH
jgi:hypothetical protein